MLIFRDLDITTEVGKFLFIMEHIVSVFYKFILFYHFIDVSPFFLLFVVLVDVLLHKLRLTLVDAMLFLALSNLV